MNKIIITICTLCMLCISCIESSKVKYTIKGTTANITDGEKVYLIAAEGNRAIIDSTIIINNSFTFKGTQPKVCFAFISVGKKGIIVILENGTINAYLYNREKVTGTPTNDILNACNEKINAFNDKFNTLRKQLSELKEDQKDEKAVLKKKHEELSNEQIAVIKECINQNLNNIVGAYLLYRYEFYLTNEEISKFLANASLIMKENDLIGEVIEDQEGAIRSEIGQKFTNFKSKDPNDKEVALSDYMEKGKYVLIDFWASWCGPCRKEIPYLKSAYKKFKSKGFEIVGVSLDSKKEDWLKCIKDLGITWPQISDFKEGQRGKGTKLYGINSIPKTFLVDPNGIIIAKNLRGEEIEKKLSELLN